jgi:ArsR family transcriptional regulator, lead/cadmium/zinc/bismuth-responsive transcriptional repressor
MKRKRQSGDPPTKSLDGACEVDLVNPRLVLEARAALPSESELQRAADAFRVLANPNRLRVLRALQGRELCVCDLRDVLQISMSGTSQVLRELRHLGAVEYRADGKLAFYRLADSSWLEIAETVLSRFVPADAR